MKKRSLRTTIIISFSALITSVILILSFSSSYITGNMLNDITSNNGYQAISQLNLIIENYISYMDDMAHVVLSNTNVNRANDNPQEFLSTIISARRDIESIILAYEDGNIYTDNSMDPINKSLNLRKLDWYIYAATIDENGYISSAHVQNIIEDQFPWVISLSREIVNPESREKTGAILVDLNYAVIEELCKNIKLGNKGYVFIVNSSGDIIYHPRQQLIYSNLKTEKIDDVLKNNNMSFKAKVDNQDLIYSSITSDKTGWTIVGVSFLDELNRNRDRVIIVFAFIGMLCFIFLMAISFILSRMITKPIQVLRDSMVRVQHGDFSFSLPALGHYEVAELAYDFNIAIKKIGELIEENKVEQELKRKHELRALQAQINPHFLYNTLDSIIWMIECEEYEDAIDMTTALAHFFRLGISKGKDIISIRSVTDHIESYLTIQKLRYKDTLDYTIDVDPELYEYQTLKLLIQPFVENSIYHGIKNKNGSGQIEIKGYKENNRLVFTVSDNGVGLSEENIKMLESFKKPTLGTSGIGIYNVRQRIKLFFGEEFDVKYTSKLNEGTTVKIILPLILGGKIW